MIVTSDKQTFETLVEAQVHEIELLLKKELPENPITASHIATFLVDSWELIEKILKQKPQKGKPPVKRTRKSAATSTTMVPGPGLPESGLPTAKAKRTTVVVPESPEASIGSKIEPSEKWKGK